ncbi:hypothetical protein M6D81_14265 [Paenibacillus sp. J5C_2022]|uniref:hypothetical protein n=1 Tax=Paenibacillus sp. J5C2022 TaxID=2977129 RepID=UPI0021D32E33|nr:hypothetical protein [Paenibacillus sp. J5C2022]MCU6709855.1 hypothetical protein [Paenibacillus sp. J5C2022]
MLECDRTCGCGWPFATNSLVVAAGAIIVYKEKLTAMQWLAFCCMIAGLVVIRL